MAYIKPMAAMKPWLAAGLCGLFVLCGPPFASQAEAMLADPPAVGSGAESALPSLAPANPLLWLDRIGAASRELNYVGTFSYQTGWRTETSRVAHRYAGGEESERLEVLDGSPREVIRRGAVVRCVLPAQRTLIIGQAGARGSFPGRLPQSHAELTGNYRVHLGEVGRIAGLEAQKVVLEPRDDLRFGHVLWADLQSGLLLKSQVLDAKGDVVEQFAFSDVRIGGEVGDDLLEPRVKVGPDWRTVDVGGDEGKPVVGAWALKEPLPGFTLVTKIRHRSGGALQMVFSDGLAAISIFIEPATGVEARGAYPGGGAVNVFERISGGHRITVLGEVPASLVQRAAESVEEIK